jgi:3,4-dihydroxy-2-butanone 4-phosphate synthase
MLTALAQQEKGEFIIVLDSQDRENEGDLIIAAESITAAQMAFLVRYTRCVHSPMHIPPPIQRTGS